MHHGAERHAGERHAIAALDAGLIARHNLIAGLDPFGGNDITPLAIHIEQQGDMGAAVRVIFDALHPGRDHILVALEIDHAIALFGAAAAMAYADAAAVVAPGVAGLFFQ